VGVCKVDGHARSEVEGGESREPLEHPHKTIRLNFPVIEVKLVKAWDSVVEFERNYIPVPAGDAETRNVERNNGGILEDQKGPPSSTGKKK
jgi:hypothetical protein